MSDFVDINGLPLLACLTVSGVLVYLGMHVVQRKVIFVDLALAQIAAFGVMWAILMGYNHEEDTLAVTAYSLAFTVVGALIFSITRTEHDDVPHEAIIGIIYVTATAAGLVLSDRFALGTEAMKELIAGRVALVTWPTFVKLGLTCALVGVFHLALYKRFMLVSAEPERAAAQGVNLRLWDFLFYVSFGFLITQAVGILGVLPVFAYLVIPAVAAAFLFRSVRARLLFGWAFAAAVSLVGLEGARRFGMDPGPTIVCLFSALLVVLGVFLYLRRQRFALRPLLRAGAMALFFGAFVSSTFLFQKKPETDELAQALLLARSDDAANLRKALDSFRRLPGAKPQWLPLVLPMLEHPDEVARQEAIKLLGELGDRSVLPNLIARLDPDREEDDGAREMVVASLRALGDPTSVAALVAAAQDEPEADIAVEMCEAAFELADSQRLGEVRTAVDILLRVMADDDNPRAARRDAHEHLRQHLSQAAPATDGDSPDALVEWWQPIRDTALWDPASRRLVPPTTGTDVE